MSGNDERNPFEVLELPVDASNAAIVERHNELCATMPEEKHRALHRAKRELITNPVQRYVHELLEVPGANYREQLWSEFERAHRANPVTPAELRDAASGPRIEDFKLAPIIGHLLDAELAPPQIDLRSALLDAPVLPCDGAVLVEVNDVIFG